MATTYQQVVDRARVPLNDAAKARYTDDELLSYLNDGMQAIFILRPDLFTITANIPCTAGNLKQVLPAGGVALVDVFQVQNGRAVQECDFKTLRMFRPTWRTDAAGPAQNWFRVPEDPAQQDTASFYVYPVAPVGQNLAVQYSVVPSAVLLANIGTANLPVTDQYAVSLQHYVTGRAEIKDDEHVNTGRAKLMGDMFAQQVMTAAKTEQVEA